MFKSFLTLLVVIGISATSCFGAQNFLNSVVFDATDGQYNIVLRSDATAKVKKTVQANDKITLTIKGITPANNINTIYKNVSTTNPMIVENIGNDELKLHIQTPNASSANIMFNTPDSAPIFIGERFGQEKINWGLTALGLVGLVLYTTNRKTRKVCQKRELRDREIEFYKAKLPSMNYKPAYKYTMNTIKKEVVYR